MKYRQLGNTGIQVSEIGFGGWGIGGITPGATSYGSTDDDTSARALACALEKGINFYDTSNVYGAGHSEVLIGRVLKKSRDRVIITTKAGLPGYGEAPDFSPAGIQRSVEASLGRLQTDYIDLLLFHNPEVEGMGQEILRLVDKWRQNGTIRSFGVSVRTPEDGMKILETLSPDAIQTNFNLMDRRAIESGLFDRALEVKTSIIARTPLCFGFLSGGIEPDAVFRREDHRSRWSKKQITLWAEGARKLMECKSDAIVQTNTQFALRFCLSYPAVASTIPGMLTEAEVLENGHASELGALTEMELSKVALVYRESNGFVDMETMKIAQRKDPGKQDSAGSR